MGDGGMHARFHFTYQTVMLYTRAHNHSIRNEPFHEIQGLAVQDQVE